MYRRGQVSIRPRLWGRGKQEAKETFTEADKFQSAPGFGAGGNGAADILGYTKQGFQSAPGFGAGGNVTSRAWSLRSCPFQSAPGFGAGGNMPPPCMIS